MTLSSPPTLSSLVPFSHRCFDRLGDPGVVLVAPIGPSGEKPATRLRAIASDPAPPPVQGDEVPGHTLARARKQALEQDLVGLALSGGGIRSATFALGVLQALAQLRLLGTIDYLSTVSGGGYIGSWFSAWVQREGSLTNVERQLSPNRISQSQAQRVGEGLKQPVDEEPEPVHHLRAYSRYLSPRHGAFSPDSWTLLTIVLRNLFVNSLFIVPFAVALVFLWRLGIHGFDTFAGADAGTELIGPVWRGEWETVWGWLTTRRFWATLGLIGSFGVGSSFLIWEQENLFEAALDRRFRGRKAEGLWTIHFGILFCLLLTTVFASWVFSVDPLSAGRKSQPGEGTLPPLDEYAGVPRLLAVLARRILQAVRHLLRERPKPRAAARRLEAFSERRSGFPGLARGPRPDVRAGLGRPTRSIRTGNRLRGADRQRCREESLARCGGETLPLVPLPGGRIDEIPGPLLLWDRLCRQHRPPPPLAASVTR